MKRFLCLLSLLLLLGACATKVKPNAEVRGKSPRQKDPDRVPIVSPDHLVPLAFGADGFPKIKKFYRGPGSNSPLEHIETDFNGDGRTDFIQYFDPEGKWVQKEASDLDGDGRMDVTYIYRRRTPQAEAELAVQEFDTRYEGRTSLWKYFENGELIRREIDRKNSGKPDYWEYYEKRKLVRIDKDDDGDAFPDSQPRFEQVIKPRGSEGALKQ